MALNRDQVEKLRERAGVSREEAQAALESSGGDLLEAMLWLERQGKVPPSPGGCYSTRHGGRGELSLTAQRSSQGQTHAQGWAARLWSFLCQLFSRGLRNQFQVTRHGGTLLSVPVLVLALLLLTAFWVVVPLAVVGLFLGCRYRFSGPDLGKEGVNDVMDSVAKTAEDIKRNVKNNFKN